MKLNVDKLYDDICRKAFHVEPVKATVKLKKLRKSLAYVKCIPTKWGGEKTKIRVLKKLKFSNSLVAQCLIHEIAHIVSGQHNHNDKFYRAYFKAAKSKFGRRFY